MPGSRLNDSKELQITHMSYTRSPVRTLSVRIVAKCAKPQRNVGGKTRTHVRRLVRSGLYATLQQGDHYP